MRTDNNGFPRFIQLLIVSVRLFFKHWKFFLPVSLLFMLPENLINTVISEPSFSALDNLLKGKITTNDLLVLLLVFCVSITLTPLVYAAVADMVVRFSRGEKPTLQTILDSSVNKFFKLSYTAFLNSLFVFIPSVLVIPSVYFMVIFGFKDIIVATTDKWGVSALQQSRTAVKSNWWRTAYFMLGIELFVIFFSNIIDIFLVTMIPTGGKIGEFIIYSVTGVLSAMAAVFRTIYYFELLEHKKTESEM